MATVYIYLSKQGAHLYHGFNKHDSELGGKKHLKVQAILFASNTLSHTEQS